MAEVIRCKKPKIWDFDDVEAAKPVSERKDTLAFEALLAKSDTVNLDKTLVGVVVSFPYADGYAHYKVVKDKPLILEHIPYGDAWKLASYAENGITAEDIKEFEIRRRALARHFNS